MRSAPASSSDKFNGYALTAAENLIEAKSDPYKIKQFRFDRLHSLLFLMHTNGKRTLPKTTHQRPHRPRNHPYTRSLRDDVGFIASVHFLH